MYILNLFFKIHLKKFPSPILKRTGQVPKYKTLCYILRYFGFIIKYYFMPCLNIIIIIIYIYSGEWYAARSAACGLFVAAWSAVCPSTQESLQRLYIYIYIYIYCGYMCAYLCLCVFFACLYMLWIYVNILMYIHFAFLFVFVIFVLYFYTHKHTHVYLYMYICIYICVYMYYNAGLICTHFTSLFAKLCEDNSPMVRRAAAGVLGKLAQVSRLVKETVAKRK